MEQQRSLLPRQQGALWLLLLLVFQPYATFLSPAMAPHSMNPFNVEARDSMLDQPWPQYMGVATRNGSMPAHGPNGGPGQGEVANVTQLASIDDPVVNWVGLDGEGSSTYGSLILNMDLNIQREDDAAERCATQQRFIVVIETGADGSSHDLLLLTGDAAKVAWEVDLGEADPIRATPVATDIDGDGDVEIIVVSDGPNGLEVEAWAPELECDASGWTRTGHSNERLWTWSDADLSIGTDLPHWPTDQSGHRAVTQPLLTDADQDGNDDLVLALVDTTTDDPVVLALPLGATSPSTPMWTTTLDRGTHPSDPTAVQMDASSLSVLLTTIDASTGAMWIWKVDGSNGALDWERTPVPDTDSDSDAPRLRLPGPVIAQLDNDAEPEVVLTVPTDANGRTSGQGARFIGMDLTSTSEVFSFRTPNGYADAPPLPVDTDHDGQHDRLCWVTWYSASPSSFDREGLAGCHDVSVDPAQKEWSRIMNRAGGNDNDEIAVSPPLWMDIDGDGPQELLVAFGRRLHAFDGETGAPADVSTPWEDPVSLPHRTWAAPAVGDIDNDGAIDIVIGDMVVSQRAPDLVPLSDGRAIQFTPASPDPGESVTVSARYENVGTDPANDEVDAWLYLGETIIARHRIDELDPIDPSGDGTTVSFTVAITAELGTSMFRLVLDPNNNISEAREDNNIVTTELVVRQPYAVSLLGPSETVSVLPGGTVPFEVGVLAMGTREGRWAVQVDETGFPEGWTLTESSAFQSSFVLSEGSTMNLGWNLTIPSTALGDEEGWLDVRVELELDTTINTTLRIPMEVLRTRGLDLEGPDGTGSTYGAGRPGTSASAWFSLENLGNAQETTTSLDWSTSSWGAPRVETIDGTEAFTLSLEPGELLILRAVIDVPVTAPFGSVDDVTLTVCIGEGDSELCRALDVGFRSSHSSTIPPHHRTFPDVTVNYTITVDLPSSGALTWNTSALSALPSGWEVKAADAVLNGSGLHVEGSPNDVKTLTLSLTVPPTAPPQRLIWTLATDDTMHADLTISIHLLQRHLASLALIDPAPDANATVLNVGEEHDLTVRVSNPGNDDDTYAFTAFLDPSPNNGSVVLTTPTPTKTVAPGGSSVMTMRMTMDNDVPALEPFEVVLQVQSLFNQSVVSTVRLSVAAAPDRAWALDLAPLPDIVLPGQALSVMVNATNLGNTMDDLDLFITHHTTAVEGDNSTWPEAGAHVDDVPIGAVTAVSLPVRVPSLSWNGSTSTWQIRAEWQGQLLASVEHTVTVGRVSGWSINLSEVDLVVPPEGGIIEVPIDHLGNSPQSPWFAKVAEGWSVSVPSNGTHVAPFGASTVFLNVTPPHGTEAGDVGTVNVRISDGDGEGASTHSVPVRVSAAAGLELNNEGVWWLSPSGGMPVAWLENTGNDVARVEVTLSGQPTTWVVQGPSTLMIAPGARTGLPISLLPGEDWDGSGRLITVTVHHPMLDPMEIQIETRARDVAFASSPVLVGQYGGRHVVEFTDGHVDVFQLTEGMDIINIDEAGFKVVQFGLPTPTAIVQCNLASTVPNLGRTPFSGAIATCVGSSSSAAEVAWTLLDDKGRPVPLDHSTRMLSSTSTTWTINTSTWTPAPGQVHLQFVVHDRQGSLLEASSWSGLARAAGWNLGIATFTFDGAEAVLGIRRAGSDVIGDAPCAVHFDAGAGRKASFLVDVSGDFAPTLRIDLSGLDIPEGTEVAAELRCEAPFDVDDDDGDDRSAAIHRSGVNLGLADGGWMWALGALLLITMLGRFLLPHHKAARVTAVGGTSSSTPRPSSQQHDVALPSVESEPTDGDVTLVVEDVQEETQALDEGGLGGEASAEGEPATDPALEATDASSRLARLRGELEGGAPDDDFQRRMNRFFER